MRQITLKIIKTLVLIIGSLSAIFILLFGQKDIPLEELKTKYTNNSSIFTSINNMNVHYCDEGLRNDSIPIILIHGTGSSLHTFDNWSSKLSKTKRVVRMDLPGYGLTGPFPNRNYSKNNYVNFIKSFLDTLKIKKCILAGNSLGGNIAWLFTAKFPSKVKKLILIDASGYPNKSKDIPKNYSFQATQQTLDLMLERDKLEAKIKNSDPALTGPDKERVKAINTELEEIFINEDNRIKSNITKLNILLKEISISICNKGTDCSTDIYLSRTLEDKKHS